MRTCLRSPPVYAARQFTQPSGLRSTQLQFTQLSNLRSTPVYAALQFTQPTSLRSPPIYAALQFMQPSSSFISSFTVPLISLCSPLVKVQGSLF